MASYALFVVFAGGSAVRDASGNVTDLVNGSVMNAHPSCIANHVSIYSKIEFLIEFKNSCLFTVIILFTRHVNTASTIPTWSCS